MKDFLDKIKIQLDKNNNKKFINNLFIILMLSIIFLVVANFLVSPKALEDNINSYIEPAKSTDISYDDYSVYLEEKLVEILQKFKGVGTVDVMITLEATTEKIPAANTVKNTENTKETDSQGGSREVQREDVNIQIITKSNDGSMVVLKEINPVVQGVIVVAQGAEEPEVKEMIYEAVKTALGITGNKVQVYSSK